MTRPDMSIPVLPSRSLPRTIAFYERLGFEGELLANGTYAILTRGALELHFFPHPALDPAECYGGAYMRVAAVDPLQAALAPLGLPTQGIPRLVPVEVKPAYTLLASLPWAQRPPSVSRYCLSCAAMLP